MAKSTVNICKKLGNILIERNTLQLHWLLTAVLVSGNLVSEILDLVQEELSIWLRIQ